MSRLLILGVALGVPALSCAQSSVTPPATPAPAPVAASQVAAPAASASISHEDLLARQARGGALLLDVRTSTEFTAGHIAGARNISHDELANRLSELPADKNAEIILYCRSGRRSQLAIETLRAQGYQRLLHLEGDFLGWQAAGRPVTAAPASAKP